MKKAMKAAALMLSAAMAFSALPSAAMFTAYAAETEKATTAETEALKSAIAEVKKRITIPKELKEFSYQTKTSYGMTFFQLKWYREEKRQRDNGTTYTVTPESITVEYHDGMITAYSYYDEDYSYYVSKAGFAKLSADKQYEFTKKALEELVPDLKGNAVIERSTSDTALRSSTVTYTVSRVENGVNMDKNYGRITIDRDTGKLMSFGLNWWNDAVFQDASKKLSVEEVSEIYKERKGLKAHYTMFTESEYDKKTGTYTYTPYILPIYEPEKTGENEIDALTGEYTSLYADMKKLSYTDAYTWGTGDGGMYDEEVCEEVEFEEDCVEEEKNFSEAELAALEKENSYISAKKALEIIKADSIIKFDDKLVQKSKTLGSYTDIKGEERAAWNLRYDYTTSKNTEDQITLEVRMDALTGEIINFSKSYAYGKNSPTKNTTAVKHSEAVKKANEAAKHFLGDKASEYKLTGSSTLYKDSISQWLTYTRYVNGLPTDFDRISINVNSLGEVLSFSYEYHDMEFPEANLVSVDEAYEKLFDKMKPTLYYTGFLDLKFKSHIYLTYRFESYYMINALTGERINYSGDPYYTEVIETEEKQVKYTDISGHKYEKEINTLLDYGICITKDDKLNPDENITIGEFLALCKAAYGIDFGRLYPSDSRWDAASEQYITITHPDLEKKLTNAVLAKIYVYLYTNSTDAAEIKGIFKQPYSDVSESSPYCGYIAIAKALGYTDDGDKFKPNAGISKGKCLKTAYDYLCGSDTLKLYEIVK